NIDVAKRSIDYLIKNSSQLNEVSVGFYGGEPLLEFDLIKQIVEYVKVVGEGKEIYFNLTTNATLFNEEIIEFFVKNNITTMISLDGGKEIHDKSRKFANTGEGSHDVVLKNVRYIKNKYPEYYKKNITFNTVINSENDYISIDDFISKNETLKDSNFLASTLNNNYSDKEIVSSDEYILGKSYD
ncbi:radical SAM protein, partial [Clostridioides difficile]|nr:radical SAM protein [Clostridioides difficile]